MNDYSDDIEEIGNRARTGDCDARVVDKDAVAYVNEALAGGFDTDAAATVFGVLADPTRLKILYALTFEDLCVCELAVITGISQSGVSHQLRVLRELGMVAFVRDGRRAVYSAAAPGIREMLRCVQLHARKKSGDVTAAA